MEKEGTRLSITQIRHCCLLRYVVKSFGNRQSCLDGAHRIVISNSLTLNRPSMY